jgi:hypothetical protein
VGSGLFDKEQVAFNALPDIVYQPIPPDVSLAELAANLNKETAWKERPVVWTHLRSAGFSYRMVPNKLLHSASWKFNMERLDGVHQFDYKCDPLTGKRYDQKRFGHSFDVAAVANLLVHHNAQDLSPAERKATVLGAFLHDLLMPPGGDATKLMNPDLFDEDINFVAFAQSEAFWEFCAQHDVDAALVAQVMREEGPGGVLKDLADKIGYVCRDLDVLLTAPGRLHHSQADLFGHIMDIIGRCAEPGLFWQSVRVHDGQVVVEDVDRLCAFLELRALLFRCIYQNPATRMAGFVYGEVIVRFLCETGVLAPDSMLNMTDTDLDLIIDRYIDWADGEELERIRCDNLALAVAQQQRMFQDGVVFSVIADYSKSPSPGTHFLVPTPSGPQPLAQAFPDRADRIHRLASEAGNVYLFAIRKPKAAFRLGLVAKLRKHLALRFGEHAA